MPFISLTDVMCNFQVTLTCLLTEILSVQPISLHKDNFLWYHSTTSTLIFPDILTKMSVKTYPLFVRKKTNLPVAEKDANDI